MINLPEHKQLILFDGVCNLCNASVNYVIKHDKKDVFRFAALQSEIGQHIVGEYNIDISEIDSIILFSEEQKLSYKSTAALNIAKQLGFPRNLVLVFIIVPAFIRNWVYDYIAKNRYKWYGKRENCIMPTPEIESKFI